MFKHPVFNLLKNALKGQRRNIFILFITLLIFNLIELSFPKLFQMFVDLLKNKETSLFGYKISISAINLQNIYFIPLALLVLSILKWITSYIRIFFQSIISQTAIYRLRDKIYQKIHQLNFHFHDNFHSGNLISNMVEDIRFLNQFLDVGLFTLIESFLYITMSYLFLVIISWPIALTCIAIQFSSTILSLLLLKKSYPRLIKTKELFSTMVEDFTENMEGNLITSSLGIKQIKIRQNQQKVKALHDSTHTEIVYISVFHQINIWTSYLNIFVGVSLSVYLFQKGSIATIGTIFLIFYLLNAIVPRIRVYARAADLLLRTMVTAKRIQAIFASKDVITDEGKLTLEKNQTIKLNRISFEYIPGKKVLNNIQIQIPENKLIGLVGFTGSGKTTFLQILARFYDPIGGEITLNDVPLENYTIKSIREKMALVFQETFLFSTTIEENISFGSPKASLKEVERVSKLACIHEFISTLPNGYQTEVGEKGVSLSGGQKQRIGIARALLQQPQVLLMDDCTSALDAETEIKIINNIAFSRKDTTTIFTSQRLNSLINCEYLYVMDQGSIVEEGDFKTLSQQGTFFMKIFSPVPDKKGEDLHG